MGLFGGKISKITATHAENISDKDIVYNIMSSTDAKKNFPREQFQGFMQLFNQYASKKIAFPSNAERYSNRAFAIAYEFESYGFPYEYCHGTAYDVYQMYTEKKPVFEEAVITFIDQFKAIIDDIIRDNNLNEDDAVICSGWYFSTALAAFKNMGNMKCETDYLPYFFQTLREVYINSIVGPYVQDETAEKKMINYQNLIHNCFEESYDKNESLEGFLVDFTKGFMSALGASDDEDNYNAILGTITEWAEMTKEYANAY